MPNLLDQQIDAVEKEAEKIAEGVSDLGFTSDRGPEGRRKIMEGITSLVLMVLDHIDRES